MKLSEIVVSEAVIPSLASAKRDEVVSELIDALVSAGTLREAWRDEVVRAVLEREKRGSTGFGKGVAVPHVKREKHPSVSLAVGLSPTGVDFNALDKSPVHSVFLLVSPSEKPEEHLRAMEVIFKHLSYEMFRKFLRQAQSREDVLELLREADAQHGGG